MSIEKTDGHFRSVATDFCDDFDWGSGSCDCDDQKSTTSNCSSSCFDG
jgi:hypothetical protein